MEHFKRVIKVVLSNEGGYVEDNGGPTNFGITLHTLQSYFKDFKQVDKDGNGKINIYDIQHLTQQDAEEFYKKFWWDKYRYNEIDDYKVALKVMDFSIMAGPYQCHLIVQRALNTNLVNDLKEDGIMGDKTLLELNSIYPDIFIASFKAAACEFIRHIIDKRKAKLEQYKEGWLKRIRS